MPAAIKFTPSMLEKIEDLACEGYSRSRIAKRIHVNHITFITAIERDDRVRAAWEAGLEREKELLMEATRSKAIGGSIRHMQLYGELRFKEKWLMSEGGNRSSGVRIIVNSALGLMGGESVEVIEGELGSDALGGDSLPSDSGIGSGAYSLGSDINDH